MILLALVNLGDEAYGVPIAGEIEKHRGREVSLGSIYAALDRLEVRGIVASRLGDPTPERGGKARRYFRITDEGLRQLADTRKVLEKMWSRMPALKGERA